MIRARGRFTKPEARNVSECWSMGFLFKIRQALSKPAVVVELFIAANLAFLAVDIYVAHSTNQFAHWAEWIPFGFSLASPVLLLATYATARGIEPGLRATNQ